MKLRDARGVDRAKGPAVNLNMVAVEVAHFWRDMMMAVVSLGRF